MTRGGNSDLIDIEVYLHVETTKAVFVSDNGNEDEAVWLPKSQIEIEKKPKSRTATITGPEWLMIDKGLI